MNSRERIQCALSHRQPDKLPVDFGSWPETGIHISMVSRLRDYYGLDRTPVKLIEPYQMLGEIKNDLKEIIGIDTAVIEENSTFFGYKRENWKEWELNDRTKVLVPGLFNTERNVDGSIYQYPEGDKNSSPSAEMPSKGFYFDTIIRQESLSGKKPDPEDNLEEFQLITEDVLQYLKKSTVQLYNNTDYAILGVVSNSSFGDIALVPGPMLKHPKGIRDIEEWYISLYTRKNYIKEVFRRQCEIAIENYKKVYTSIGNKISVVYSSGADFGAQQGLMISLENYREVFKPFHKKVNEWIHNNTNWKCHIHTCGSVYDLIPDLIDAGFDTLNPIQLAASNMDPKKLKKEFGKYITYWGGGIDTQKTLPFGNPEEVKKEVRELIEIFFKDGGFVFNTVHNIQPNVPVENVVAMIEVIQEYRK